MGAAVRGVRVSLLGELRALYARPTSRIYVRKGRTESTGCRGDHAPPRRFTDVPSTTPAIEAIRVKSSLVASTRSQLLHERMRHCAPMRSLRLAASKPWRSSGSTRSRDVEVDQAQPSPLVESPGDDSGIVSRQRAPEGMRAH